MNRAERRARVNTKPRTFVVTATLTLCVEATTSREAEEKARNTPMTEWGGFELEGEPEVVEA